MRGRAVLWGRVVLIAGAAGLLELLCRLGIVDALTLLPPSEMVAAMVQVIASGSVTADMLRTFTTVAVAFTLAVGVGAGFGTILHAVPRLRRALDPLLASYYAVPLFVFYPLLVAVFGLNALPLIVLGFASATVAMAIGTLNGLDRTPPVLLKAARVHRLGRLRTALLVVLPAAAPDLLSGLKLSLAYAFIGIIAGEFILSGRGLGYQIAYAYDSFDNRTMYGLMLFVLLVATAMNTALHLWEQHLRRRRMRA
ncbi:MAG: ABC transporter permease subunit [Rhodospirillales bacterium]|nr:ABC transporter permease subunit [Rhodospirillales bacterium]